MLIPYAVTTHHYKIIYTPAPIILGARITVTYHTRTLTLNLKFLYIHLISSIELPTIHSLSSPQQKLDLDLLMKRFI